MSSSLRPFRWLNTCSHHCRPIHLSALKTSRTVKVQGTPLTYDDLRPYEPIEQIQVYRDQTAYISFLDHRVALQFALAHGQHTQSSDDVSRLNPITLARLWKGESRTFVWRPRGEQDLTLDIDGVRKQFRTFGMVLDVKEVEHISRKRAYSIMFARLEDAVEAAKSYPPKDIEHIPFEIGPIQQAVRTFPAFQVWDKYNMAYNVVHIRDFVPTEENWSRLYTALWDINIDNCMRLDNNTLALKFTEPACLNTFLRRAPKGKGNLWPWLRSVCSRPVQSTFYQHRWLAAQLGIARRIKLRIPVNLLLKSASLVGKRLKLEPGAVEAKLKESFSVLGLVGCVNTHAGAGFVDFMDIEGAVEAMLRAPESIPGLEDEQMIFFPRIGSDSGHSYG
ncbi:hypothetical protein VNI00_014460 [Paramarasmius palmivorus]|uniref:RRM domain-containing protein n=1 Tax=Paramarasmius palmivorus TaxID=297713 RepID=A0AAW0BSE9_9AGAR